MLYMITERFKPGKVRELYERFASKGRLLPEGLHYVNSWVNAEMTTCWQLMETDDRGLLNKWISYWQDLADFEVATLISSAEARERQLGPS